MNKQRGYMNLDFTGLFVVGGVVCTIAGIVVWEALQWAWPYIKSAIHAMTA